MRDAIGYSKVAQAYLLPLRHNDIASPNLVNRLGTQLFSMVKPRARGHMMSTIGEKRFWLAAVACLNIN